MINAKRAKALRKAVRQYLGDLPKVAYTFISGTPRLVLGVDRAVVATGTQRYAYLAAKKHLAAAR